MSYIRSGGYVLMKTRSAGKRDGSSSARWIVQCGSSAQVRAFRDSAETLRETLAALRRGETITSEDDL